MKKIEIKALQVYFEILYGKKASFKILACIYFWERARQVPPISLPTFCSGNLATWLENITSGTLLKCVVIPGLDNVMG